MTDFGPRQYCNRLLCPEKRLKQQEDTDAEGNDTGPDDRESTENEYNRQGFQSMPAELDIGRHHEGPPWSALYQMHDRHGCKLTVQYYLRRPNWQLGMRPNAEWA